MELAELIRGAQEAMDRGDFLLAANACAHALESYPACLTAHRMRGEALLERGELDAAAEHFERTLALDPLNVVARLGLGVVAEERKDTGLAYAQYLQAWEINPALDQVREQLVRLRGELGADDRLHPTRVGLAHIYARAGQFRRAAAEWRAILAADTNNQRARTALLEVFWRSGDDSGAAALCREILAAEPENARALAIQADIERRLSSIAPSDAATRYQAADPIGEIALLLTDLRDGADLSWLVRESAPLPDFDFSQATAESQEQPDASAAPALGAMHVPAPDLWDSVVRDLQTPSNGDASSEEELQPFTWSDDGDLAALGNIEPFSLEGLEELEVPAEAEPVAVGAPLAASASESGPIGNGSPESVEHALQELTAAVENAPTPEPTPSLQPPTASAPPADDSLVSDDGQIDLTAGWDDLDRALKEATPDTPSVTGFEDLVAELDAGGVVPFSADESDPSDAWEPFTAADFADLESRPEEQAAQATQPQEATPDVAAEASSDNLADLGEEVIAGIPPQQPTGYTELLRNVDQESLPELDDDSDKVDPLALPDTVGEPLDFEDLLAVTSRDGTSPLGAETPAANAEPIADPGDAVGAELPADLLVAEGDSLGAEPAAGPGIDLEIPGVEPFSLEEIGPPPASDTPDFSDLNAELGAEPFDLAALDQIAVTEAAAGEAPLTAEAPMDTPVAADPVPAPSMAEVAAVAESQPQERPAAEEATPVSVEAPRWPTVISQTSDLFDRREGVDGLFARLRATKRSLVEAGQLVVDRSLSPAQPPAAAEVPVAVAVGQNGVKPANEPAPDLMAMRLRLIESEDAAREVAQTLEAQIAQGYTEPLALRVLGEAYLRLGRTEQAAAQFRQAMLSRRRSRMNAQRSLG